MCGRCVLCPTTAEGGVGNCGKPAADAKPANLVPSKPVRLETLAARRKAGKPAQTAVTGLP